MRAHGIDISHHQECFQPEQAAGRVEHATLRLSYGMDIDTRWSAYQEGAAQVPLRGAYQYLRSSQPWQEQAELALSMLQEAVLPYRWLVVDVERYGNVLDERFAHSAWMWLDYVSNRFAGKVLLYTSPDVFDTCLGYYISDWEIYELWLAQYWWNPDPERKNPRLPRRWLGTWRMWQYMSWGRGRKYGVCSTNVDLDVFNGTVEEMQAWSGETVSPPPAEAGCTFRTLTDGLRVRTGPGTQYAVVGHLSANTLVRVERIAGDAAWAQIAPGRFAAVTYRGRRHMEMVSDE